MNVSLDLVSITFVFQVFRQRTPDDAINLVSRLLEYTPSARITPLQACAHKFFDELRDPATRLPNNRDLPPLFNFTDKGKFFCWEQFEIELKNPPFLFAELKIQSELNSKLIPPHFRNDSGKSGECAEGAAAASSDN